jgi:hypothetical protein
MPHAFDTIELPRRSKGRQSQEKADRYDADVERFCRQIIQINSTLDFKVSSRGWCYILEEHGLEKGDFDVAQRLINDCRKSGDLSLDICAEDEARLADNLEELDEEDPVKEANKAIITIQNWGNIYHPISFWEFQDYYIEMVVEKIDLKSLFSPICEEFHIPCTNSRGWSDINSRARMAERVKISVYADVAFRDDLNTLAAENQVTVSKLLYDMARDYVRREAPLLAERNKVFEDLGW